MENQYSINDISSICKVSKQSLYALIKKNQEFINENSTRKQRKIYYNQAALDFFMNYYNTEKPQEGEEQPQENDKNAPPAPSEEETYKSKVEKLESELDALQAQIDALNKKLSESEEERKELLRQNGALLLMLQQEKQERALLLPAPRKTIAEKLKGLFKKDS